jgi:SEC-C motif-containing protein
MSLCPCGSGLEYSTCCEPILQDRSRAETAEQMMRARYSAHVKLAIDFIAETTHPDQRDGYDEKTAREWAEESDWLGLEIINATGGAADDKGEVEFVARYRMKNANHSHHERASFERQDGLWYFTDGVMVKNAPITVEKVGRNEPCPCGSGKKFKKCCG